MCDSVFLPFRKLKIRQPRVMLFPCEVSSTMSTLAALGHSAAVKNVQIEPDCRYTARERPEQRTRVQDNETASAHKAIVGNRHQSVAGNHAKSKSSVVHGRDARRRRVAWGCYAVVGSRSAGHWMKTAAVKGSERGDRVLLIPMLPCCLSVCSRLRESLKVVLNCQPELLA